MDKRRLSEIMARDDGGEVECLARWVEERYPATVLREPATTLVMLPVQEPVRGTRFYIGELLATEAMVELNGARGIGVCMGEDSGKALAMAVIDAAFNAGLDECAWLKEKLEALEKRQIDRLALENALHLSTKVSFDTMEGNS
jgi:alpha-D-ribose 1-methylphosphonate 5-triphosphate synthase subunit PhnG